MWEMLFYIIGAPILMLVITLFGRFKMKNVWFGPLLTFIILNIPTIILPFIYEVGCGALLGWATLYTVISVIVTLITMLLKPNN